MAVNNNVRLIGHVGQSPEVKSFDNGSKVANFSIAISKVYKDKDGNRQDSTQWFNLVAWRKLAEIVESYVKKGSHVAVEGELATRSWDDAEGNKKYATEVILNGLTILDKKQSPEVASVDDTNEEKVPF